MIKYIAKITYFFEKNFNEITRIVGVTWTGPTTLNHPLKIKKSMFYIVSITSYNLN